MNIQEKIKQCEAHGFKVKQIGSWLWLTGTDGRYKKQNGDYILLDQETKILFALGFKYSKSRGQYYWDDTNYNTLYVQVKQKYDQAQKEIEAIQQQIEKEKEFFDEKINRIMELMNNGNIEEAKRIFNTETEEEKEVKRIIDELERELKYKQRKLTEIEKEMKRYKSRIKAKDGEAW